MKTYKIITNTGFTQYVGSSQSPETYFYENLGFDFDAFNSRWVNRPKWSKSSGVITSIELFYCDIENKQVKRLLTN